MFFKKGDNYTSNYVMSYIHLSYNPQPVLSHATAPNLVNSLRVETLKPGEGFFVLFCFVLFSCFPGGASGKEPSSQCRRQKRCSVIPGSARTPEESAWQPLLYSCLGSPMHRGGWRATVCRAAESLT